jgi:aspartyl-tRNA(Asn)/glutamyl-tRNA(Gln) amidotransferase subunit B
MSGLVPVIGLEVHVQLGTRTKLFCGDLAEFGAPPNQNVCPVCLGLPGALPVLNARAVELAVRTALGLGCEVHEQSVFARKNYFYPDLPKGYQITQFDRPLATGGTLAAPDEAGAVHAVRIRRIHLEEDAGKSLHDRLPGRTAIDLNRAGVPLVEIVTEPDVVSPAHARAVLGLLKQTLEYLEVSDCDMEKGSLRVDANVSLRPRAATRLGTKTEVKNMNSFSNVERALTFEIARQAESIAAGRAIVQETLLWDAARAEARPMRSKEESHDYRYFPEPDLPPLVVESVRVHDWRAALPELPMQKELRFREAYGIPAYDAAVLAASRPVADYFEAVAGACGDAKAASNWVMTDVLGWINRNRKSIADLPITAPDLAELIRFVSDGTLSGSMARQVFSTAAESGTPPRRIVESEGLAQIRDDERLRAWVEAIIRANADVVARYHAGETKLMSFFVGQVMKLSRGKADPRRTTEIVQELLGS